MIKIKDNLISDIRDIKPSVHTYKYLLIIKIFSNIFKILCVELQRTQKSVNMSRNEVTLISQTVTVAYVGLVICQCPVMAFNHLCNSPKSRQSAVV